MTLSATQDDCIDKLVWSGGGFARAALGLSVKLPAGKVLDAKISGSSGANCPLTVENNQLVCRLGHNGLIVTIELEFLDMTRSIALNIVLIEPGGDAPVSFGLPTLN